MFPKWIFRVALVLLAIVVVTTVFFGLIKTEKYSAYAECRKLAMTTKGYGVWDHERTFSMVFSSLVSFSDGYNELSCTANGIGPFWVVQRSMKTNAACANSLTYDGVDLCPEDYFGVSP
ncbi:MAG TPA: hypothetical protein VFC02_23870 [Anaerolineales bacterium]|nr:hypothetical protein [Anaerolineales bacterium]